ncbi:MAG: phospholipase D-like domain-containing protein, partial [Planctomycetota bacterium]
RSERKALRRVIEDIAPDRRERAIIRSRVFAAALDALPDSRAEPVIEWLHDVLGVLHDPAVTRGEESSLEVLFSPGEDCVRRIAALIGSARESVDVCVYTITDDRIAGPLLEAHRRGVALRIISDDEKADDSGSDVLRLRQAGIPVVFDDSQWQMHHKFAIFDESIVITGSYNWTRTAADHNQENVVVSDDPRLVGAFAAEFERLWKLFRG